MTDPKCQLRGSFKLIVIAFAGWQRESKTSYRRPSARRHHNFNLKTGANLGMNVLLASEITSSNPVFVSLALGVWTL